MSWLLFRFLAHCLVSMFVVVCVLATVGFHNVNLRILNVRVSNPSKLIVDVFVDTMSDFNVPGSRPKKKHYEILEIDRTSSCFFWRGSSSRGRTAAGS